MMALRLLLLLLSIVFAMATDVRGLAVVAVEDQYGVQRNNTLTVEAPGVLLNDDSSSGGIRNATLGTTVTNGVLVFASNGGFIYTPTAGFVGNDTFTYRVTDSSGVSNEATVTIVVASLPVPPSDLFASAIRGNRVTLQWTPASGAQGYLIQGGPTAGATTGSVEAGNPPFTLDIPNGRFFVRVRTVLINPRPFFAIYSAPSNEIEVYVNQPVAPAPPRNLLATVTGDSLSLAWRNAYTAGEPTGLTLDVSGSLTASLPLPLMESATFANVPSGSYSLRLRSTNAAGSSGPANPVTITVPGPCSGPPEPPTRFLTYQTLRTIFAFWEPPISGPAPTGYVLNVGGAFVGSFATSDRALSGTVAAGTYDLSVVATNACGTSTPTPVRTLTVAGF